MSFLFSHPLSSPISLAHITRLHHSPTSLAYTTPAPILLNQARSSSSITTTTTTSCSLLFCRERRDHPAHKPIGSPSSPPSVPSALRDGFACDSSSQGLKPSFLPISNAALFLSRMYSSIIECPWISSSARPGDFTLDGVAGSRFSSSGGGLPKPVACWSRGWESARSKSGGFLQRRADLVKG